MKIENSSSGTSLIDLIISIGIIAVLFGGIYLVYFSILAATGNINVRTAAATAIGTELETIRNLPYASVGTVGGVPSGVIPQTQAVTVSGYDFILTTTIRNIDDPFDGTLGGSPNDTAPADYKLVAVDATCPFCQNPLDVEITTTVAPANLESAPIDGSLFLYALDANGEPVSDAEVTVVNASVTPSIDLTDTTNASGVLELVGVPTSTQGYSVVVTKPGYSTDETYAPGAARNPSPTEPNLTAAAQTVTAATFSIDKLSQVTVYTSDERCVPVGSESFSLAGTKLIGSPDVLKFATTSATNAAGMMTLPNIEWDTYNFTLNDASRDLAGTIPMNPLAINPSSTISFRFISEPTANPALLTTVIDSATGVAISNATATISKSGFSESLATGQATLFQSDWSGGQYFEENGVDPDSAPGKLTLALNASGTYPTSPTSWLMSKTFDLGGSSSTFYSIAWNPVSQPAQTGANSLEFQVAGNADNATWNFIGPDGTSKTYFTSPALLPASLDGDRYFRYEAFLTTQDENYTPELDDVTIGFAADCVPPGQALFTSLPTGNYTLDIAAANYGENSTTITIGNGFQSSTIELTHL